MSIKLTKLIRWLVPTTGLLLLCLFAVEMDTSLLSSYLRIPLVENRLNFKLGSILAGIFFLVWGLVLIFSKENQDKKMKKLGYYFIVAAFLSFILQD